MTLIPASLNWAPGSCRGKGPQQEGAASQKTGSWLDHLTQVISPWGQKRRDSETGLPLMTVRVVSITVSFSAGPEGGPPPVGSQFPSRGWDSGQEAELGKP